MKSFKFSNLLDGDLKIVEKKKIWFSIPAAIIALALVMIIVFAFAADSALNLGVDFAGGHAVTVKFTRLTDQNFDEYVDQIDQIATNLSDEDGNNYGLKISRYRRLGSNASDSAIYINYKNIKGFSEEKMEKVNERFEEELKDLIIHIIPSVEISAGKATLTYNRTMSAFRNDIQNGITQKYAGAQLTWLDPAPNQVDVDAEEVFFTRLEFTNADALNATKEDIIEAASIPDIFSGSISPSAIISGSVSSDFINYALSAFIVALFVMLLCVAIRFKSLSTAIASLVAVLLPLVLMFCFIAIAYIEINVYFIAALFTVLCFATNNTLVIFNKISEVSKRPAELSANEVINTSVKETLKRSLISTMGVILLVLAIVVVCAIAGVLDMVTFALPIIFGLIASTYCALMVAPPIYAMLSKKPTKHKPSVKAKKKEPTTI